MDQLLILSTQNCAKNLNIGDNVIAKHSFANVFSFFATVFCVEHKFHELILCLTF